MFWVRFLLVKINPEINLLTSGERLAWAAERFLTQGAELMRV